MSDQESDSALDPITREVSEIGHDEHDPDLITITPTFTYQERSANTPLRQAEGFTLAPQYQTINISNELADLSTEARDAIQRINDALNLRKKYCAFDRYSPFDDYPALHNPQPFDPKNPPKVEKSKEQLRMRNGVMRVYESLEDLEDENPLFDCVSLQDFFDDIKILLKTASHGPSKSLAFKRLDFLEAKFKMHAQLNHDIEYAEQRGVSHRDFYNVRKVDNHVHLASCMNQKHLLRFIKHKFKTEPDRVVKKLEGVDMTLAQVFEKVQLTPYDLSIDHLDMHADVHTFHRFDRFNEKYNPCGLGLLREVFLKTDNDIEGRYMAEVVKQVFSDLEDSKYQMAEYRVSVYGRSMNEWEKLSKWVVDNEIFSTHTRWMIQIPRLYHVFRSNGSVANFQQLLDNLFLPLFEATRDPESHPEIHAFLTHVVAFDSVDDESKPEHKMFRKYPRPSDWDIQNNPPYTYYIYYMWANLHVLNSYRRSKGLNMFALRPHCGESGDVDHLAAGFLTAQSIAHGLTLRKNPVMMYLFYLSQIGISLSPLSNNKLFLRYERNPFPKYFNIGLNVALSTDDPLQIHMTREPLVEEYSIACQLYRLTSMDICEVARNSVLQSGFENEVKAQWIGDNWLKPFVSGNDMSKTNVPQIRMAYRETTMRLEYQFLSRPAR
eukprot:c495_g1_i2.p1 GENE.c495_g1_i2~~c495_g1_i2.p1  ORF type:complete len:670 (+),score=150.89 c495_g1_i2:23-2011(+)